VKSVSTPSISRKTFKSESCPEAGEAEGLDGKDLWRLKELS